MPLLSESFVLLQGSFVLQGSENAPRFQVLLAGLNGLRTTTYELRREMDYLQKNVTVLTNLTRFNFHTSNHSDYTKHQTNIKLVSYTEIRVKY